MQMHKVDTVCNKIYMEERAGGLVIYLLAEIFHLQKKTGKTAGK